MPRQFGLVPMPAMPDPLQSLSGMMALASNMEGYQDARRQREEAERIKQTVAASGGDPMAAADTLAREGHIGPAMQLRDSANVSATRAMGARAQANEVQQQEGQMRDASAARSIMSKALRKGENGLTTFDRDLLTQEFTTAGLGHQLPELFKGLDEADAASLKFSEARREAVAGIAYGIHSAGNTPQALQLGIDYALANGLATERELVPLRRAAQADPKQIASITQGLFAQSPKFAQLQGDEAERAALAGERQAQAASRATDDARQERSLADEMRHRRVMEARAVQQTSDDPGPLETIIGPDGKPVRVARKDAVGKTPAAGTMKPATGLERRALNFFNRMQQADKDLEAIEKEVSGMGLGGQVYAKWAPNVAQTQIGQLMHQAQRAFTEARLRKDSGAAIPEHEFESDRQTYFPQPGDTAQTLAQKRRARGAMLASLGFESGQALGEFVGDSDEARRIVDDYRQRSARPEAGGGGTKPAMVKMRAPNGFIKEVPADQVEHFKAKGATVAQ